MIQVFRSEQEIKDILNEYILKDPASIELIIRAWNFAKFWHKGQQRSSGEPHTEHLFETAKKLSELGMDADTIAAGILHDTIEDTGATEDILKKEFGKEIALLVSGVTKLKRRERDRTSYQAKNLQKFFVAAAKDPRILIIKLCDRLHNMDTLQFLPPQKRIHIAQETLDIYVPVADRLGMNAIRRKLEDLSFSYLEPKTFKKNELSFAQQLSKRQPSVTKAMDTLTKYLTVSCSSSAQIEQRIKGKYSFYKKLLRKNGNLSAINDIITLQVIVPHIVDCYTTLGNIHALWRPVPSKMKDYIAFPKPNNYQCLRTSVSSDSLGIIEIQIYSTKMYERAQYGIASCAIHHEYDQLAQQPFHTRATIFRFFEDRLLRLISKLLLPRQLHDKSRPSTNSI